MRVCACAHVSSSILTQRRLRLLGHISPMNDYCLPIMLLVCAPVGGSRRAGGQKRRWSDIIIKDLKDCELDEDRQELALDWSAILVSTGQRWCEGIESAFGAGRAEEEG